MKTWNSRLTDVREEKKISKAAFSRAVGVSQPTVTDWESGEIKKIDGANLVKVCHVLGITPEWLLTGRGTPDRPAPVLPEPPTVADTLESLRELIETQPEAVRQAIAGLVAEYLKSPDAESGQALAGMTADSARPLLGSRVKVSGRYQADRQGRPRLLLVERIESAEQQARLAL